MGAHLGHYVADFATGPDRAVHVAVVERIAEHYGIRPYMLGLIHPWVALRLPSGASRIACGPARPPRYAHPHMKGYTP